MEYTVSVGRNISGIRGHRQLSQTALAAQMREMGFTEWRQQTVARTEKGLRRLAVEEALGLAFALETNVSRLLAPVDYDVQFQGVTYEAGYLADLVAGVRPVPR